MEKPLQSAIFLVDFFRWAQLTWDMGEIATDSATDSANDSPTDSANQFLYTHFLFENRSFCLQNDRFSNMMMIILPATCRQKDRFSNRERALHASEMVNFQIGNERSGEKNSAKIIQNDRFPNKERALGWYKKQREKTHQGFLCCSSPFFSTFSDDDEWSKS